MTEQEILTTKLVSHYDDLCEVLCDCAFTLEGLGCIAVLEEVIDEDTAAGVRLQSARIRERLTRLKTDLNDILNTAKSLH